MSLSIRLTPQKLYGDVAQIEVDVSGKEIIVELRKVKNGPAIKGIEVRALPKK